MKFLCKFTKTLCKTPKYLYPNLEPANPFQNSLQERMCYIYVCQVILNKRQIFRSFYCNKLCIFTFLRSFSLHCSIYSANKQTKNNYNHYNKYQTTKSEGDSKCLLVGVLTSST